MMALTKTPFLVPLITTMCCRTAHKKPLVAEKRRAVRGRRKEGGEGENTDTHADVQGGTRCGLMF